MKTWFKLVSLLFVYNIKETLRIDWIIKYLLKTSLIIFSNYTYCVVIIYSALYTHLEESKQRVFRMANLSAKEIKGAGVNKWLFARLYWRTCVRNEIYNFCMILRSRNWIWNLDIFLMFMRGHWYYGCFR